MTFSLSARTQESYGKQTNPWCVTHSATVLKSGQPPGTVPLPKALLPGDLRGKGQGAASREKWQQGRETGTSRGACAERALSMRPERGPRGLGLGGRAKTGPIPSQAEKGFLWAEQRNRAA